MAKWACVALALVLVLVVLASEATERTFELYMPDADTARADSYMTTTAPLPASRTYYIVEFEPTDFVSMDTVHHLMVHGCLKAVKIGHETICEDAKIMYVWARNAPKFTLPEGMGFKVGRGTPITYLKLTVHFASTPHPNDILTDQIGVKLQMTDKPQPKTVGVFLLLTGGKISPGTVEHFDVACKMEENVEMHPFAFRPHTHKHGKVVSGYVVREANGADEWTLLGKQDPMLPQMFYPIEHAEGKTIMPNDTLAARCTMKNTGEKSVYIGGTSHDEMCNFYIMYWVRNDNHPKEDLCESVGPPDYYWEKDPNLNNIPSDSDHL